MPPARRKPEPLADASVETAAMLEGSNVVSETEPAETPEQRRIRELEARLAAAEAAASATSTEDDADEGDTIVIHFVNDGFTALGQSWYRGQELEFTKGSGAYQDTLDREGNSWLDLRHDEDAQEAKYGEVKFRNGPWKGKTFLDARFDTLKRLASDGKVNLPTEEELRQAEAAKRSRRRTAPRLPVVK